MDGGGTATVGEITSKVLAVQRDLLKRFELDHSEQRGTRVGSRRFSRIARYTDRYPGFPSPSAVRSRIKAYYHF